MNIRIERKHFRQRIKQCVFLLINYWTLEFLCTKLNLISDPCQSIQDLFAYVYLFFIYIKPVCRDGNEEPIMNVTEGSKFRVEGLYDDRKCCPTSSQTYILLIIRINNFNVVNVDIWIFLNRCKRVSILLQYSLCIVNRFNKTKT